MSQVVATHFSSIDLLPSMMSRLKQHMLEHYAMTEINVEAVRRWDKHFDYVVVDCDERQVLNLLSTLSNKGCDDLHVYTKDKTIKSLLEDGYYGNWRVVDGLFLRERNEH